MGDAVIGEMRNLGLLVRTGEGNLTMASDSPGSDEDELLAYLELRLLDPFVADQYHQRSFPRALAWFLTKDPSIPLEWGRNYREDVSKDCGEDVGSYELTNEARWGQFVYWARYLGFAWRLQAGWNVVIPDPTEVLARYLPTTAIAEGKASVSDVMSELSASLPVFEGGSARS